MTPEGLVRMPARQTSLIDAVWIPVKDGNDTGRSIFNGHYSRRTYKDGRDPLLYVGPGGKVVLITPDATALFAWRLFISDAHELGVNCAVFRNEGPSLSSNLIVAAHPFAWNRWPSERRLYTYVDPTKIRKKRDPGRCFLRAGWRHCGWTASGLRILEFWR